MKHLLFIMFLVITISSCKSPEARLPEQANSGSFIKQSVERNKKLNAFEREKIETVINSYSDKTFINSENGFWYHYTTKVETDVPTPQFGDLVNFNYDVSDLNGTTIYTKNELGSQDYLIDKEDLFKGLREGLKLMKPNEEITFIFPSQIAYGYYGDEHKIGTNVPLICNVTLNTITKNNDD